MVTVRFFDVDKGGGSQSKSSVRHPATRDRLELDVDSTGLKSPVHFQH